MAEATSVFRILVVDDEPMILELVREILEGRGWVAETLASPLDALDRIRRERFDAVVLDLYMPDLPGMLLHAKLKLLDGELAERTLFMTGHFAREALRHDLVESGHLLLKPFSAESLIERVSRLLPARPRRESAPAQVGKPSGA